MGEAVRSYEMIKLTLTLVAAAVALAGCGGSSGPTVVAADPETTTPLSTGQEASLEMKHGPDWLTGLNSFVFVKQDSGLVTKIDAATNKPVGEVQADTKSQDRVICQGVGAGGGSVWACSGNDVVRIDPAAMEVTDSIPAGKIPDSGRLVFGAGKIWALSGNGDRLAAIDAATGNQEPALPLPTSCTELGAGVDRVWAICPNANLVLGIDPEKRTIEEEIDVASPTVAFGTETDVWIGYAEGLGRFDADSLDQEAVFTGLDPTTEGTLTVAGEDVWVRQPAGFLYRIDAATNTVAEQIVPDEPLSGGDVLVLDGAVWVSAFDDNLVLRLRS
jgi:streptogramin lyase